MSKQEWCVEPSLRDENKDLLHDNSELEEKVSAMEDRIEELEFAIVQAVAHLRNDLFKTRVSNALCFLEDVEILGDGPDD